eukprot:gene16454-biopygen5901
MRVNVEVEFHQTQKSQTEEMEHSAPDCTFGSLAHLSGCSFPTRDSSSERRPQNPERRTQLNAERRRTQNAGSERRTQLNASAAERRTQESERRTQDLERRTQLNANAAEDAVFSCLRLHLSS